MIPTPCATLCAGCVHDPGSGVNEGLAGVRCDGHAQGVCRSFGAGRDGAPSRSLLWSSVCVPWSSRRSDQSDLVGRSGRVPVLEAPGARPVRVAVIGDGQACDWSHSTSERWRSMRRLSGRTIPMLQGASTTSPSFTALRAATMRRSHFKSGHWRSRRMFSARTIPRSPPASVISLCCTCARAATMRRSHSTSRHWRSRKRLSAQNIPRSPPISITSLSFTASRAATRRPSRSISERGFSRNLDIYTRETGPVL